jgi:hypothetical protein
MVKAFFSFFLFLLGPPIILTLQNWKFLVGKTHLNFLFFGQKIAKEINFTTIKKIIWANLVGNGNME